MRCFGKAQDICGIREGDWAMYRGGVANGPLLQQPSPAVSEPLGPDLTK